MTAIKAGSVILRAQEPSQRRPVRLCGPSRCRLFSLQPDLSAFPSYHHRSQAEQLMADKSDCQLTECNRLCQSWL
jgi:hypothetical protein